MRKLILIVHTSLDGFVANPDGELNWFEPGEENLQFVCKITEGADAAVFGRTSYQLLDRHWPTAKDNPDASDGEIKYSNWYNAATKIVLSKSIEGSALSDTIVIAENVAAEILKLKQQPGKDMLIFGSPTAFRSLLSTGLIDAYWIFINPVIFGKGLPLFFGSGSKTNLELVETKQFPNGEIAHHYVVVPGNRCE